MYKLIFLILFLLIFVNISIGKNCKCDKNKDKKIFYRRYKRGNCICCDGNEEIKEVKGEEREEVSSPNLALDTQNVIEESEIEEESQIQIIKDIPESSSRNVKNSKKKALYICDNFYYSHIQLNVI